MKSGQVECNSKSAKAKLISERTDVSLISMSPAYLLSILLLTILWIIITGSYFRWHPLFSLISATFGFGVLTGMDAKLLLETMGQGFGSLIGSIGLVVVLGSILGVQLEQSGTVQQLGKALTDRAKSRPSLGIAFLGMLLGIPVFCDSGFMVLASLMKSMALSSNTPLPVMSLSLAGGLYTTHTLVPPTPGPVAAICNVGAADAIGLVMVLGIVVSIPVTLAAYFFARYQGSKLTCTDQINQAQESNANNSSGSASQALLLILLPILLIAAGSTLELFSIEGTIEDVVTLLGKPLIALLISVVVAMILFRKQGRTNKMIERGIMQAGPIILLTGCGGALGAVLKVSPLSELISTWVSGQALTGISFLGIAFVIGALFKTSQGSSTSSLVLTSALLSPLLIQAGFDTSLELSLLVLAIGAGAMTVSHANDSYFWVVSQFSGFDLKTGYKGMTLMTVVQGLVAFLMVIVLYSMLS
jgi:GntP family gluconate:H+ symporter